MSAESEYIAGLEQEIEQVKAYNAGLMALMKIPDNTCLVCGGDSGHEEGCMGTTALVALTAELEAVRIGYKVENDSLRQEIRDLGKLRKDCMEENERLNRDLDDLKQSILNLSHPNCRMLLDENTLLKRQLAELSHKLHGK